MTLMDGHIGHQGTTASTSSAKTGVHQTNLTQMVEYVEKDYSDSGGNRAWNMRKSRPAFENVQTDNTGKMKQQTVGETPYVSSLSKQSSCCLS